MPNAMHYRAKIASLTRSRSADDPELAAARQCLTAIRLEDYAREIADAAPTLTAEQRQRVVGVLRAAGVA